MEGDSGVGICDLCEIKLEAAFRNRDRFGEGEDGWLLAVSVVGLERSKDCSKLS